MSTAVLPSLVGLGFPVKRTAMWSNIVQAASSGKEVRIAQWTFPKYKWTLLYNVLRSNMGWTELQTLLGFFNQRQGMFDSFLYRDADDNSVVNQTIGVGDGVTTVFQMARAFGNAVEPVLAVDTTYPCLIYINGTLLTSGVSVNLWGTSDVNGPGAVIFATPPASGAVITATFNYLYPVRMSADNMDFEMFLSGYYKAGNFSFESIKG